MTDKQKQKKSARDQSITLPINLPDLLLSWYDRAARVLPWRKDCEPYRVWVSEIMLQQTGVATVCNYYIRFLAAFPTVVALASADEQQVLKLWEGLGYYSRARNLKKAAEIIVRDYGGRFPDTYSDIIKLPGIGAYTAGAIASICFEQPFPAVDGNVARVVSRIAGQGFWDNNALKKAALTSLAAIYPEIRRGDFTQSLMELGALVCVPSGAAKCDICPASGCCAAFKTDSVSLLPARQDKPSKKHVDITVFILMCGGDLAIRHRDKTGLLSSLWEFPNVEGHLSETEAFTLATDWGTHPSTVNSVKRQKHIFTHIQWDMLCYTIECAAQPPLLTWASRLSLSDRYPLPTAFRKLIER